MANDLTPNSGLQCWVCELPAKPWLFPCSKCKHHFHDGLCGEVPVAARSDPIDPDDRLRGQWIGSQSIKKDRSAAKCGICSGRFPREREPRLALIMEQRERDQQEQEQRSQELRKSEEQLAKIVLLESELTRSLEALKDRVTRASDEILDMEDSIDLERRRWMRIKSLVDSQGRLNKEAAIELELPLDQIQGLTLLPLLQEHCKAIEREGKDLVAKKIHLDQHLTTLELEAASLGMKRSAVVSKRIAIETRLSSLIRGK